MKQHAEVAVSSPEQPEFAELASRAWVILVRNPLPESVFAQALPLRAVVRHGAGLDMIPVEAASAHAIAVANVPAVNAPTVAEYVLGQMVALTRGLNLQNHLMRSARWAEAREVAGKGADLRGRTVAIVGVGAVGSAVARICHLGFGMQVLGVSRSRQTPNSEFLRYVELEDAFAQADFVVLSCPLTQQTHHLLNADRLALMRREAFLINVSRGAVVDEAALIQALQAGSIAGAALDVFEKQPLPASSPLLSMPQVLLSPHAAGISRQSMQAMSCKAVEQVIQVLSGQLPTHLVNSDCAPQILARWARLSA